STYSFVFAGFSRVESPESDEACPWQTSCGGPVYSARSDPIARFLLKGRKVSCPERKKTLCLLEQKGNAKTNRYIAPACAIPLVAQEHSTTVQKTRVPDTFQLSAILPFSAYCALRKNNNLRVFNTPVHSDSPASMDLSHL